MKGIGERFKRVREMLGLSQAKFAELLGLKQGFVSNIETSYRVPDEQTLRLIENEFGVSRQWLTTGEGFIFKDSERALQTFRKAKTFDIEVIFYILSKIQDIYSKFSDYSVNEAIILNIDKIISKNLENLDYSEDKKHNKGIDVSKMISVLTKHFIDNSFKVSEKLNEDLQLFVKDLGIHIFTAAVLYEKYKLIPLESVYIDMKKIKQVNNTSSVDIFENLVVEGSGVKLHYFGKFILEFIGKGYIGFEREKLFGFASTALNIKDDESKEILDYEIFYSTTDKSASIKQKDITLSLSIDEFNTLKSCFEKLRENTKLWQWLQACYIEKYGFV